MTLHQFLKILRKEFWVILLITLTLPVLVYFLSKRQQESYRVNAMVYTGIASGYNIESGESEKVDYHAINNAFDNFISVLKSRETLEEVGLALLAQHLMQQEPDETVVDVTYFHELAKIIPFHKRRYLVASTQDSTLLNLQKEFADGNVLIRELILEKNGPYGLKQLQSIAAKRVKSSDMVQVSYEFPDGAIAKHTVDILLDHFMERYKGLKGSETLSVVAYFEAQLTRVQVNLKQAEDKLKRFRSENRVINYGEQTKAIAIKKQNALEEYEAMKRELSAKESGLEKIEEKLSIRENLLAVNTELITKKQALTGITRKIALAETGDEGDSTVRSLLTKQAAIKEEISQSLHHLFELSNSKEGLPSQQLLDEWLEHVIAIDRERVALSLFQRRLTAIDQEYDHFAPLGSTIDRFEREIQVIEQEFLEVLHGLNMAKLKQQNIDLASELKIVDRPSFPSEALRSKRMLLVMVAFAFGFVGSISFFVIKELVDPRLKHPEKGEALSGLKVAGTLPVLNARFASNYSKKLPHQLINLAATKMMSLAEKDKKPLQIVVSSVLAGEGKSFVTGWLGRILEQQGYQVLVLRPWGDHFDTEHERIISPEPLKIPSGCDVALLELPSTGRGNVPIEWMKSADIQLVVARADKVWSKAHDSLVEQYRNLDTTPLLFVNGIECQYLDQVLGELPRKNNNLLAAIKKWLNVRLVALRYSQAHE